ncbi:MAG: rod shape-determining protein MreD [Coriobacteriales bacterium]
MDKGLVYIITVAVCTLLQLAIAPAVQLFGALPNFLIIPVLFIGLRSGVAAGAVAGFALGLLYDFAGDGVIGAMALTLVIAGVVCGALGSNMETGPVMAAVIGIVVSMLASLLFGVATVLGSSAVGGSLGTMVTYALPCGAYTAVFAAIGLATMSMVTPAEAPRMGSGLGLGGRGGFLG